jgi:hypothetical protein
MFSPVNSPMTEEITLQARDKNGNKITTGGAKIVFTLAAGSVGGLTTTLGQDGTMSVTATDNYNGTYTAYYTSSRVGVGSTIGTAKITATINGTEATAAPTTTATFYTDFATNSNFNNAPWMTGEGYFPEPNGGSVTTDNSQGTNIGTYGGPVAQGTGTSATVGLTVPQSPSSGTFIGLVSRYEGVLHYYFAGLQAGPTGHQWVITRVKLGKSKTLVSVPARHLQANQVVNITFDAVGSHLQLFVSGHKRPVLSTKDRRYTSGNVGILGTANVTFDGPFTAKPIDK